MRALVWASTIAILATGCQKDTNDFSIDKSNSDQTIAYSLGADIGRNVSTQEPSLDINAFVAGIRDGYTGAEPKLTQEETVAALTEFRKRMMAKRQDMAAMEQGGDEQMQKNKEMGEKFLTANAQREGVVVLPSGLQYLVEKEGKGKSPSATDRVRVHYRGTLVNGEQFDSSYDRGQPAEFPVNGVIKGWTEALQLMKPGAKWRLYIPADLAYGDRGAGPKIGPGSVLQFEVELLEVL